MKRETLQRLAKKFMEQRVSIPAHKINGFEIKHTLHQPGAKLMVVGMREMLFTGLPQTDYIVTKPTVIHSLCSDEDGVWMTDLPCEIVQMHRELAIHATGNVLVGGLGLGLVARMAALKSKVKSVTVVERQPEVIELVGRYLNGKTKIVQGDIHEYTKTIQPGQFDCALLDTWQGTGEWVWQSEVVPLRRTIGDKIRHVHCWQEQVMKGQIAMGMFRALAVTNVEMFRSQSHVPKYAFNRAVAEMHVENVATVTDLQDFQGLMKAEEANRNNEVLRNYVGLFLHYVGTGAWEHLFGKYWDEAWGAKEAA